MSDDRIDEVQELYDRCNKIAKYANWLFLINIACHIIFLYKNSYKLTTLLIYFRF